MKKQDTHILSLEMSFSTIEIFTHTHIYISAPSFQSIKVVQMKINTYEPFLL